MSYKILGPRKDFISVDVAFMAIAKVMAMRSKDPNTQVGACIVDDLNHIIGTGYNGFPQGIDNNALPWNRDGDPKFLKYQFIAHAEENALDNSDRTKIHGSRIYVTLFPCNACAIRLINNRVKEIIYLYDIYHDTDSCRAARKMLKLAKVKTKKLEFKKEMIINLK